MGRDVGHDVIFRPIRIAGEVLGLIQTAQPIARRMAFGAMAQMADQILAAVQLIAQVGIGLERSLLQIACFPDHQRQTEAGIPDQLVVPVLPLHRGHGVQIGLQGFEIGVRHPGISRVGKRRIVMGAIGADALAEGANELGFAPAADTRIRVRGDVGRIKRAEGALQPRAAGQLGLSGLAVAAAAAARVGQIGPLGDQVVLGRSRTAQQQKAGREAGPCATMMLSWPACSRHGSPYRNRPLRRKPW